MLGYHGKRFDDIFLDEHAKGEKGDEKLEEYLNFQSLEETPEQRLLLMATSFSLSLNYYSQYHSQENQPSHFYMGSFAVLLHKLHEENFNEKNGEEKIRTLKSILEIAKPTKDVNVAVFPNDSELRAAIRTSFHEKGIKIRNSLSQKHQTNLEVKLSDSEQVKIYALHIQKEIKEEEERKFLNIDGERLDLPISLTDKLRHIEVAGMKLYVPKFYFLLGMGLQVNEKNPKKRRIIDAYNLLGYLISSQGFGKKYGTEMEKMLYLDSKLPSVNSNLEQVYKLDERLSLTNITYEEISKQIYYPIENLDRFILKSGIYSSLIKEDLNESMERIKNYSNRMGEKESIKLELGRELLNSSPENKKQFEYQIGKIKKFLNGENL